MAAQYNPNQQVYPPQVQSACPRQAAYGYPPQEEVADAQYHPPPSVLSYPPQAYPHQPVHHTALEPPPAYDYNEEQLAYNYSPPLANTTVVVAAQPAPATTTRLSPPVKDHTGIALCAFMFSVCTLVVCGPSLICLPLSIPALILSLLALGVKGSAQKNNAGVSIALNVAVVVFTVVLVVAVVTPIELTANTVSASAPTSVAPTTTSFYRHCPAYYSAYYSTHCQPYSYSTTGSCSYYYTTTSTRNGYCPHMAYTPRPSSYVYCQSYYSSEYKTYCQPYNTYASYSCNFYGVSTPYCPT